MQARKFTGMYRVVTPQPAMGTMTDQQDLGSGGMSANYNFYQRLVQGSASRLTQYREFDLIDNDVEISRSLDTIAEEMSGNETKEGLPTEVEFKAQPTGTGGASSRTIAIIKKAHERWSEFYELDSKIFHINRVTVKYGDCFFIRNKETQTWEFLSPKNVIGAIVDKRDVTKVIGWQIAKDPYGMTYAPTAVGSGTPQNVTTENVPTEDIVWFSLNNSMSEGAPFGDSVLKPVYKAQKQKELVEDSVIIYRVSRAPERRVFYVDVGKMPPNRVKSHLEQMRIEMRQRKTPNGFGSEGGSVDAAYNPMSTNEDIFLATRDGGRGTKVEPLPGGCLAMDTEILLLNGQIKTITELEQDRKNGIVNWTFSTNPHTGEIVPGLISWAGRTRMSAKVVKISLSNGEYITATPCHRFPIVGRGLIRADALRPGYEFFGVVMQPGDIGNDMQQVNTNKEWSSVSEFVDSSVGLNELPEGYMDEDHPVMISGEGITVMRVMKQREQMPVGTLTVDFHEKWHNYHNYSLAIGIFTQNSSTGVIDDLEYFQWKVYRGLRIPLSYMKEGADNAQVNDGANAYVAELRFALYISRLQKQVNRTLDREFKLFLKRVGIMVDDSLFKVSLPEPENFGVYRKLALDQELLNTAQVADGISTISKRMILQQYLQWDEDDIKLNERYKLMEMGIDPDSPEADISLVYGGGAGDDAGGDGGMLAGGFNDDFDEQEVEFDDGQAADNVAEPEG